MVRSSARAEAVERVDAGKTYVMNLTCHVEATGIVNIATHHPRCVASLEPIAA